MYWGVIMKTYTIIGGVNGTGKSSLTGVLRTEIDNLGKIIDVDKLNIVYGDIVSGGKAAIKLIDDCLEMGICFTQETTLSGHKTVATAKKALENGYYVRMYYVGLNTLDESLSRIKNRVAKGGHDIPEENVKRRFESRFSDVAAVLPYCNEATFYDNENGFRTVAKYKNGELNFVGSDTPQWISELAKHLSIAQ